MEYGRIPPRSLQERSLSILGRKCLGTYSETTVISTTKHTSHNLSAVTHASQLRHTQPPALLAPRAAASTGSRPLRRSWSPRSTKEHAEARRPRVGHHHGGQGARHVGPGPAMPELWRIVLRRLHAHRLYTHILDSRTSRSGTRTRTRTRPTTRT